MDVPQFDAHLPTEGQLGGFQFLPVMNKVAVDIHVQKKKNAGRKLLWMITGDISEKVVFKQMPEG